MTLAAIAKTLAKELSTSDKYVEGVLRLLDEGLKAPTIAHYRRADIGELTEGAIRRIERRRRQLEEVDRRRRSLLRSVAKEIRAVQRADAEAAKKVSFGAEEASAQGDVPTGSVPAESTEPGPEVAEGAVESLDADTGAEMAESESSVPESSTEATDLSSTESAGADSPSADSSGVESAGVESVEQASAKPVAETKPKPDLDPLVEYPEVSATLVKAAFRCSERIDLEDVFLPLRRPEPEVQLAADRGLRDLANLLVKAGPRQVEEEQAAAPAEEAPVEEPQAEDAVPAQADGAPTQEESASAEEAVVEEPAAAEAAATEPGAVQAGPESEAPAAEAAPEAGASGDETAATADKPKEKPKGKQKQAPKPARQVEFNADLARICAPFVNTDRGIHSDQEALEGAMRILSDRLGRDPKVRSMLRRLVRKSARISVRALVDEKQLGRNRSLVKLKLPVRQLQGHKLMSLRQAQIRRQVSVGIDLQYSLAIPKLVAALGTRIPPERLGVLEVVAERALSRRLMPMLEEDLRTEIRERAEEEAIRSIAQNLRQTLLAPPGGRRVCAGINIDPKGDWTAVVLGAEGEVLGEPVKIEASTMEPSQLTDPLRAHLAPHDVGVIAVSSEKSAKEGIKKLRNTLHLLGGAAAVVPINDAGLSGWANGEAARTEFPDMPVPARTALGFARRWQDPLAELVRVETRQLGLGLEQGIVGRGALRRLIADTLESCVAYIGCDVNKSPLHLLRHIPGIDFEVAKKIIARRTEKPFTSLQELVDEGLLTAENFRNAAGFLQLEGAENPLDRTSVHPEQLELVNSMAERLGVSLGEAIGNRDLLRSLKRGGFEIEEGTWHDLMRGLASPGRDPRARALIPRLLPPDTEMESLAKDQVVEGVVASVASFGAFVDLGIARDGMIHISEVSQRYVRDARALLAVGQVVRAKITNPESPRIELTLKGVPDPRRGGPRGGQRGGGRGERQGERGGGGGGGGRGGREKESFSENQPIVRAARSRRDGLGAGGGGGKGRGGGGGGRSFGGGRGGPGGRRGAEEGFDREAVRKAASEKVSAYNPFANFFKQKGDETEKSEQEQKGE
ncbi:MAG: hypothetical protein ACI8PQ_002364 [Planctomycetota bacterium]